MSIRLHIGKIGQRRSVQDPQKLLEATEGKHRDLANEIPLEARYPTVNKSPDKQPFVIRS